MCAQHLTCKFLFDNILVGQSFITFFKYEIVTLLELVLYTITSVLNPTRRLTRLKTRVKGFDQVIQVNHNFFINQNDVVLFKKNKLSTGYNRVFDQVLPDQPGY